MSSIESFILGITAASHHVRETANCTRDMMMQEYLDALAEEIKKLTPETVIHFTNIERAKRTAFNEGRASALKEAEELLFSINLDSTARSMFLRKLRDIE